jgi:hypothetical protein
MSSRFIKIIFSSLLFVLTLIIGTRAIAQGQFALSGTVTDENNALIKGATVFISGTQKITATDDKGHFTFNGLNSGSYQLVVKALGYDNHFQNVMLNLKAVDLNIQLKIKPYTLKEVVIGVDKHRDERYNLFVENFLGTSRNADNCKIVNPGILNLHYDKEYKTLEGTTDDFLIIENKRLGYRIKYLLKIFEYNYQTHATIYDGETSFEDMNGTADQKKKWAQNRLKEYNGSLMHFLRALYINKEEPLKEGFLLRPIYEQVGEGEQGRNTLFSVGAPIKYDSLVSVVDTSFISLKFKSKLYVVYDPKLVAKMRSLPPVAATDRKWTQFGYFASILILSSKEAIIDSRGRYTDYGAFLIDGTWGEMRLADQLPFEYQPPAVASN